MPAQCRLEARPSSRPPPKSRVIMHSLAAGRPVLL
jgi:hypothetical protein